MPAACYGNNGQTACVWDAETGQPITPPLMHEDIVFIVTSAQFSPDGQRLVTACLPILASKATRRDAETGQPMTLPLKHEEHHFRPVQFDGECIVTASTTKRHRSGMFL